MSPTEMDSFAIMGRAHEHGTNFFDTANVYGGAIPPSGPRDGLPQQIVGRWFAKGGGRQERTVLGTKVYAPMSDRPNESKGRRSTSVGRATLPWPDCRLTISTFTKSTIAPAGKRVPKLDHRPLIITLVRCLHKCRSYHACRRQAEPVLA